MWFKLFQADVTSDGKLLSFFSYFLKRKSRLIKATHADSALNYDKVLFSCLDTSAKVKAKLSLEMVRSCDKKGDCHLAELRTTDTPNTTLIGCMIEQV